MPRAPGLAGLLLFLAGCAAAPQQELTVASRHDPAYDFAAARTYAWGEAVPTGDPRLDDLQLDARLRAMVGALLADRGLREAANDPDLTVWFYKALQDRVDVVVVGRGAGFASAQAATGVDSAETTVDVYSRGGLVLDLVDATSNRVVWRGRVAGRVDTTASQAERDARLRRALSLMLADYPPRPAE